MIETDVDVEAIERELTTLAGLLNAGNFRFLQLVAEFDRRKGYVGIGIASCAHWLSWRCGLSLITAREQVRVAHALEKLPLVADAMRRGVLSYCKVRALTRIATPENERWLVSIAENGTVSQLEKVVRLYRGCERSEELEQANAQVAERYLQYYVDENGSLVIRGRLAPEQGALVVKALQGAADVLREAANDSRESLGAPDEPRDVHAARNADALALLAETFIAQGSTTLAASERTVVSVHVDETVLRDETHDGRCELGGQTAIPPATARRLACDASVVAITETSNGEPLNLGRKTRTISTRLRRALEARDRCCRFPGCTNARFVDAHHIVHWADGGRTDLGNLVLLCRRHHRFVHEHGYSLVLSNNDVEFCRPDGRVVPRVPVDVPVHAERGVTELRRSLVKAGVTIDHDTGDSHWRGDAMDYDWVITALFRCDDEGRRERAAG